MNHSLTLFLSILTQYFIVNQNKKLRKGKYQYVFIVLYLYIVLDKKLIDLFGKPCRQWYVSPKILRKKIADNHKHWIGQVCVPR